MFLKIQQRTRYRYSEQVVLAPHTIRLRPREDGVQRLLQFRQRIEPEPRLTCVSLGIDGAAGTTAWFDGKFDELRITTASVVETARPDPLSDVTPHSLVGKAPVEYPRMDRETLAPYRQVIGEAAEVNEIAGRIMAEVDDDVPAFLQRLVEYVHSEINQVLREAEVGEASRPLRPTETLRRGEGACRDLAELFVEICRSAGLAMRFVSGYGTEDPKNKRYMHAWAEVYLPGPGWRGYDPSLGSAVADRHVAVAAGLHHENAAPVIGTYIGEADSVDLDYEVEVTTSDDRSTAQEWVERLQR